MFRIKQPLPNLNRREAAIGVLSLASVGLLASAPVALAQAVQLVAVDVTAVGAGYQMSKFMRKNVQNDKDEKIGTVEDFVITDDKNLFAILEVGGFLGMGGHQIAVPYESLDISADGSKIVLAGASKEAVKGLPEFKPKN